MYSTLRHLTLALALVSPLLESTAMGQDPDSRKTKYYFKLDTDRFVGVLRQDKIALGTLDRNGSFIQLPRAELLDPSRPSSDPSSEIINRPRQKNEEVYEYRSGYLIKGRLEDDGSFVPELGGKVTAFKDYVYSEKALRIYNLPGRFVKEGEKKEKGPPAAAPGVAPHRPFPLVPPK